MKFSLSERSKEVFLLFSLSKNIAIIVLVNPPWPASIIMVCICFFAFVVFETAFVKLFFGTAKQTDTIIAVKTIPASTLLHIFSPEILICFLSNKNIKSVRKVKARR